MADDGPDDQRDERVAEWLEPEPLDEVTRRRLVATAMQAREPEPATTSTPAAAAASSRAWRWIATAAAIVVLLVGALALFTAQGGNEETALDEARTTLAPANGKAEQAAPNAAPGTASAPVEVGDFGDLSDAANLRRLRTALEQRRTSAGESGSAADGSALSPDAQASTLSSLATLPCRDGLPTGTVTAVGSGTLDGRRAVVVLTDLGNGEQSIDAVLGDPCEVRPLS
jgi:hypothetical protein